MCARAASGVFICAHLCEDVYQLTAPAHDTRVESIAEQSKRADSQWQELNVDFYCVGTDTRSLGSRGASKGSSCILSFNLTTNKNKWATREHTACPRAFKTRRFIHSGTRESDTREEDGSESKDTETGCKKCKSLDLNVSQCWRLTARCIY